MTWLPRVMMPAALTSRSTSTQLVAARGPGAGPAGGGPAGRTPELRSLARSTADSREGTVLIRHPAMLMCTVVVSIQKLTVWPVLLVPSQNCCGPIVMFPDAGTTRSTSTASGQLAGSDAARACRAPDAGVVTGSRSAGAHTLSASPLTGEGRNLSAGHAMSSDWCGLWSLYSFRHASTASWASPIEANGPASLSNSTCSV